MPTLIRFGLTDADYKTSPSDGHGAQDGKPREVMLSTITSPRSRRSTCIPTKAAIPTSKIARPVAVSSSVAPATAASPRGPISKAGSTYARGKSLEALSPQGVVVEVAMVREPPFNFVVLRDAWETRALNMGKQAATPRSKLARPVVVPPTVAPSTAASPQGPISKTGSTYVRGKSPEAPSPQDVALEVVIAGESPSSFMSPRDAWEKSVLNMEKQERKAYETRCQDEDSDEETQQQRPPSQDSEPPSSSTSTPDKRLRSLKEARRQFSAGRKKAFLDQAQVLQQLSEACGAEVARSAPQADVEA